MSDLTLARSKAWHTRRAKYGPSGHGRAYRCGYSQPARNYGAVRLLIELMNEGVLSEGQVCQATGIDRVDVRRMADDARPETGGYFPKENETQGIDHILRDKGDAPPPPKEGEPG